ncbi:Ig-like domain-containing protein [Nibricoccus aquaticus]|nr:Ig-like domain-containing protein [Nibricoccus aquaticus]
MHHRIVPPTLRRALLAALALTAGTASTFAIPAFPGAEGFGANSLGGRGGTVYRVTNLNDSGAGSFRDAVSVANRTVVFDVGGIIRINSAVVVKSNITIAGQTAPGGGITIYGNRVSFSDANNTICRYIRIREGINGDSGTDAVGIASGRDMIFDHVSASWGRDETFSISGGSVANITLQDCIVGQGLLVHSAGGLVQTGGGVSIFRTLYIDNWMRNPKIKGVNDYQNNVVYNWGSGGGYIPAGDSAGDTFANMIGNYYVGGFDSGVGTSPFKTGNENYRLYHANNREDLDLDGTLDGTTVTDASFPTLQLVNTPFAYPAPLILLTPEQSLQHIATYAGASLVRDSVDTNMITELLSYGTLGKQIYNESEVGGVGTVAPAPTAVIDTDNDGMPDWWEQAAGTNAALADNNGDIDGDGYTNIENYINSLANVGVPLLAISGVATDTGVSSADEITSDGSLVINGVAPAGATVQVSRIDTGVIGSVVADSSGNWSFDYTSVVLPQRYYGFKAALDFGGGSFSLPTPTLIVNVDNTAPATPVITSLVTSPSYTFTGTAEIFSTVSVELVGVGIVATATADGVGNWSASYVGAPLPPGAYDFTATATDLAGNTGAASGLYSVNTALSSPVFTGISTDSGLSATDQITNDTTLNFTGTAPASSTIAITRVGTGVIGSATANGSGVWNFNYSGTTLASGQYTFTATAASGGSSSPASAPFLVTVDTARPTIPSIVRYNPATSATTSSTIVFRVNMDEPVINVDATDFALTKSPTSLGGTISSVVQVTPSVYDVTITGASGDGTIRLDRLASANITDYAGNVSNTAYTGGSLYTIRLAGSGVWTNTDSGGLWSDSANWEAGVIASGSGTTADFATRDIDENVVAQLDSPRTVGRVVFGDADFTTSGTWTLANNGSAANILTLAGTAPTIQVNAATTPTGDTADVPAASAYPSTLDVVLAGSGGLTKTGVGTLQITKPATITGPLTITKGIVQIGEGGSYTPDSVSIAVSQQLRVAGGSFSTPGNVTMVSGTGVGVVVSGGTASFQKIIPSNARNGMVKVTGGTMTATDISFQRSGDAANMFGVGLVIQGGESTVGTVGLGTGNSWGAMSVEGGKITVTGELNVGFQATSARGGQLRVLGGELNITDPATGLILSRNPGSNVNNVGELTITGGTVNAARVLLGYNSTASAGSATIALTNGELNIGTGGIVRNGSGTFASNVNLNSGVLGALAPWSTTTQAINVLGTPAVFQIRAANAQGTPFDIALGANVAGAGGFAKTGAGKLTLSAATTFAGSLDVNDGTLAITGSLAAGGAVNVNSGALTGTGTINKAVVLNSGAVVSPGIGGSGTLTAASLTWNAGGTLAFDLGAVSDKLAISGALSRGTSGAYTFAFTPAAPAVIGTNYTLATFGSTDFAADDFSATGLGIAKGKFVVNAGSLVFTITSDGSGQLAYDAWAAGYVFPAGLEGPAADADGDGQGNLLEFILGQNPLSAGVENVKLVTIADDGADYPALRFTRRIARGDVGLEVRVTTALDFSSTLGAVELSAVNQGNGTELVTVRSAVSYAVQPKQFLRLEATLP